MPTLQNLVLKDRTPGTPVDHTFTPDNVENGVGTVVESNGTKVGDSKFTISRKKSASGRHNIVGKLTIPVVVMETINGVQYPKVVRTAYVEVKASFDSASTTQERTNAIGMAQDSLSTTKTLVHKTFVDLEGIWG